MLLVSIELRFPHTRVRAAQEALTRDGHVDLTDLGDNVEQIEVVRELHCPGSGVHSMEKQEQLLVGLIFTFAESFQTGDEDQPYRESVKEDKHLPTKRSGQAVQSARNLGRANRTLDCPLSKIHEGLRKGLERHVSSGRVPRTAAG